MERWPGPPNGWFELQARMARAKTPAEVNQILEEMKQALDAYEEKIGSGRRSRTSPDLRKDRETGKSE